MLFFKIVHFIIFFAVTPYNTNVSFAYVEILIIGLFFT